MLEDLKKEFTSLKLLTTLLIIAVGIYLMQIAWQVLGNFSDILLIIVCAWLLSFILEPLVQFIAKISKFSLVWSALLVFLAFGVFFSVLTLILIPIAASQFNNLIEIFNAYLLNAPASIQAWNKNLFSSLDNYLVVIPSVAQFLFSTLMALILSFYLIVDKERIIKEFYDFVPNKWDKSLKFVQRVVEDTFASFLRIQVIFAVMAGITTWIAMSIFGIDFALSVSLIVTVLTIIPLVGGILGLIPPTLVAFVSNPADPTKAIILFAILLVIQQVLYNSLAPKLFGRAFKLHPIIVFMSFLIGFKLAGAPGAIFAIPILGVITVIFRELGHYFIKPLKSDK